MFSNNIKLNLSFYSMKALVDISFFLSITIIYSNSEQ